MSCRKRKKQKTEIDLLIQYKKELEGKIIQQKKHNKKIKHTKNLKIFKSTCNLISPFIIISGLTIGIVKVCGGGYPFKKDQMNRYKRYNLSYETNGIKQLEEEYQNYNFFYQEPQNTLSVSTPWEENQNYTRIKREYDVDTVNVLELWDALMNENIKYIDRNFTKYKEEIQNTNNLLEKNHLDIKANIQVWDKQDILKYDESNLQNIIVTLSELFTTILLGGLVTKLRTFNYKNSIKNIKHKYTVTSIEPLQKQLEETKSKILLLRGNSNDN